MDWTNKSVLITGGTGSLGRKFVEHLLTEQKPRRIVGFSRGKRRQHGMRQQFDHDFVVHAAALNQVPACEYNPIEAIMTNVIGARNVIDTALISNAIEFGDPWPNKIKFVSNENSAWLSVDMGEV